MNKPTVYVETTVIGHIAAGQQAVILVAAHQLTSQRWWAVRDRYKLVVSQIVVDQCSAGDTSAASERLALIANIPILAVSSDAKNLADELSVIEQVCRDRGFVPPLICSPDELLGN